ncbi:hypothetical protein BD410DRAFT_807300 [Rickenella mellea]|uniref:Uncharacterized protein n=1 Tax=Rickenella mellea TaxID=50990 RepID=A0A4Y7PR35_9AGAM|nr:hypothetical protein BD410DRAFT_807300 [Rickenella mellea]
MVMLAEVGLYDPLIDHGGLDGDKGVLSAVKGWVTKLSWATFGVHTGCVELRSVNAVVWWREGDGEVSVEYEGISWSFALDIGIKPPERIHIPCAWIRSWGTKWRPHTVPHVASKSHLEVVLSGQGSKALAQPCPTLKSPALALPSPRPARARGSCFAREKPEPEAQALGLSTTLSRWNYRRKMPKSDLEFGAGDEDYIAVDHQRQFGNQFCDVVSLSSFGEDTPAHGPVIRDPHLLSGPPISSRINDNHSMFDVPAARPAVVFPLHQVSIVDDHLPDNKPPTSAMDDFDFDNCFEFYFPWPGNTLDFAIYNTFIYS